MASNDVALMTEDQTKTGRMSAGEVHEPPAVYDGCWMFEDETTEEPWKATTRRRREAAILHVGPCVEIKFTERSLRRPPRHRRDACSMAWRCRFLTARRAARPRHAEK